MKQKISVYRRLSPACHPKKKYDGGQVFQIKLF